VQTVDEDVLDYTVRLSGWDHKFPPLLAGVPSVSVASIMENKAWQAAKNQRTLTWDGNGLRRICPGHEEEFIVVNELYTFLYLA
jgi:hypothetical protein